MPYTIRSPQFTQQFFSRWSNRGTLDLGYKPRLPHFVLSNSEITITDSEIGDLRNEIWFFCNSAVNYCLCLWPEHHPGASPGGCERCAPQYSALHRECAGRLR